RAPLDLADRSMAFGQRGVELGLRDLLAAAQDGRRQGELERQARGAIEPPQRRLEASLARQLAPRRRDVAGERGIGPVAERRGGGGADDGAVGHRGERTAEAGAIADRRDPGDAGAALLVATGDESA